MELIYESDQYFRYYDFHISHNQLLIRGDKIEDGKYNIDLIFDGTEWLNCPTKFDGIKIYLLSDKDILVRGLENQFNHRIFMIATQSKEYFIKAGNLRIFKNDLGFYESSIDMTGNGQENLLWMSKI